MALEVTSDLGIELSDLNYLCSHVSLASNCHYSLNLPGSQTPSIDFVSSTEVKISHVARVRQKLLVRFIYHELDSMD